MSVARRVICPALSRALGLCLLLLLLIVLVAPGAANAAATLDQQQPETETNVRALLRSSQSLAQTFTAGISGTLERVEVFLGGSPSGAPAAALSVEITGVNASGGPDTTKVLASASFGPKALPEVPGGGWVPINVSAPSVAGAQYAIVLFTADANGYLWPEIRTNPYAGGQLWFSPASPPATWQGEATTDMPFKTYVAAPALPTNKDQCKKGGWKNFGTTFKNQGQCVSFVEHEQHALRRLHRQRHH
jgi:hypothetical protein